MVRPFARLAIVSAAVFQRHLVKVFDRLLVARLEGDVRAAGQLALCGAAGGRRDEQLVRPEIVGAGPAHGHAKRCKHGLVEAPAGGNIGDDELNMVDQTTPVKLLCGHGLILIFEHEMTGAWRGV